MVVLKKIWRPLLALALIVILLKKGPFDLEQLKLILSHSRVLILGTVLMLTQVVLFTSRWSLFIHLSGKANFFQVFRLTLIGLFFNYFIPGGVGGDIVKALELSKNKQMTRSEALSTVMSDRVFGLFSMISFTLIFLCIEYFTTHDSYILKFLLLSAVLFVGLVFVLLFFPFLFQKISKRFLNSQNKWLHKVEKLITSLHFTFVTFRSIRIQISSFLLSFFGQLVAIYFMYEVTRAVGVTPPSFLVFFSLCCFSFVASAIPIFPAGIGVGQAAIYVMFANISPELGKASITAITALQIFNFFYALVGGILFSTMPKQHLTQD